jgi:hypothetical protein
VRDEAGSENLILVCPACCSPNIEVERADGLEPIFEVNCDACGVSATIVVQEAGREDEVEEDSAGRAEEISREWALSQATRDLVVEVFSTLTPFEALKARMAIPVFRLIKLVEKKYLTESTVGTRIDKLLTGFRILCWSFILGKMQGARKVVNEIRAINDLPPF